MTQEKNLASGLVPGAPSGHSNPMPAAPTCRYAAGQSVEVAAPDFATPGFPRAWFPATVTAVTLRDCGRLFDVAVTRADGAYAHQIVGPRGGNSNIRSAS